MKNLIRWNLKLVYMGSMRDCSPIMSIFAIKVREEESSQNDLFCANLDVLA